MLERGIGDNSPPSTIEFAKETAQALSEWMDNVPAIQTEDQAREAKLLIDRASSSMVDMDRERSQRGAPHYRKWEEINAEYREPKTLLDRVEAALKVRLRTFIEAEEAKREEEARIAAEAAEQAKQAALEAERKEQEANADAAAGVADVNIVEVVQKADEAYEEYLKRERARNRAQRARKVKVGGGFRRAASLRTQEELIVENAQQALESLGLTDDIREAVVKSARAFRKQFGELPDGVIAKTEKVL